MRKEFVYSDYAYAFNWSLNPTEEEITTYMNSIGRSQTLAFAMGLDDEVKFYEKVIAALEDKLEETILTDEAKSIPERYHH